MRPPAVVSGGEELERLRVAWADDSEVAVFERREACHAEAFRERVEDGELADRLDRAIRGRGAFRRFKDVLADHDQAMLRAWFRFADDRQRGRAREWLALEGFRPVPGGQS